MCQQLTFKKKRLWGHLAEPKKHSLKRRNQVIINDSSPAISMFCQLLQNVTPSVHEAIYKTKLTTQHYRFLRFSTPQCQFNQLANFRLSSFSVGNIYQVSLRAAQIELHSERLAHHTLHTICCSEWKCLQPVHSTSSFSQL